MIEQPSESILFSVSISGILAVRYLDQVVFLVAARPRSTPNSAPTRTLPEEGTIILAAAAQPTVVAIMVTSIALLSALRAARCRWIARFIMPLLGFMVATSRCLMQPKSEQIYQSAKAMPNYGHPICIDAMCCRKKLPPPPTAESQAPIAICSRQALCNRLQNPKHLSRRNHYQRSTSKNQERHSSKCQHEAGRIRTFSAHLSAYLDPASRSIIHACLAPMSAIGVRIKTPEGANLSGVLLFWPAERLEMVRLGDSSQPSAVTAQPACSEGFCFGSPGNRAIDRLRPTSAPPSPQPPQAVSSA